MPDKCEAAAATETATLVTAAVRNWRAIPVEKELNANEAGRFIRDQAKADGLDENKSFPFRIRGVITNFVMHVNAAPNRRSSEHGNASTWPRPPVGRGLCPCPAGDHHPLLGVSRLPAPQAACVPKEERSVSAERASADCCDPK
jgi:hypothetical protein